MTSRRANDIQPIDLSSPIPYYHQLASILRDELDLGRWKVDELIPAEGELIEMFGVSRSVTRKALDILEGEGRVLRIKGKGTLVTKPKAAFGAVATAARWHRDRTSQVTVGRVLDAARVTAGSYLGRLLEVAPGASVWEIRLTEEADGTTHTLVEMYLKIKGTLTVGAPPEFEEGGPGIYEQLAAKYGVEVTESQLEIEIAHTSSAEAAVLGVEEGAALVQVSSLDFSRNGVMGFTRSLTSTVGFFFSIFVNHGTGDHESFVSMARDLSRSTE